MLKYITMLSLCFTALVFSGCGPTGTPEEREERDPVIKSGQAFMEQQQWDEAIHAFKQSLENDPLMARPHLDLAVIYQQHKPNFIHAIYHYDRYLELRPDSEKAEFIKEQKTKLVKGLANTFINNSPEVKQLVQDSRLLRDENNKLRQQISDVRQQLAEAEKKASSVVETTESTVTTEATAQSGTSAPAATKATTSTAAGNVEIYHVVGGDTLTKIAKQFYGTDDWEPIYQANRDSLRSPRDLRVGQTLVIPMDGR